MQRQAVPLLESEAPVVGTGMGKYAALDSGDLVLLDDRVSRVPLYWQHWRLESPLLQRLSQAVISAAREALVSSPA